MVKIAIVGLGGMGNRHLGVYSRLGGADLVAVCDSDPAKLKAGQSAQEINIGVGGGALDPEKIRLYSDYSRLLADPEVEAVDICVPTFLHRDLAVKALSAGKHVLCEKPMALTVQETRDMVDASEVSGKTLMIAQCIRFWPEYAYLKEALESQRLGRLISLEMWRCGAPPLWGWRNWFMKGELSGGALLDLHVHDVDFLMYALGKPAAVRSQGAKGPTGEIDAVATQYDYGPGKIVTATGSWCLAKGFHAGYLAVFERGHIRYDRRLDPALVEATAGEEVTPALSDEDAYYQEIAYFVDCLEKGQAPAQCMPRSSALSIEVALAERRSCLSGAPESL